MPARLRGVARLPSPVQPPFNPDPPLPAARTRAFALASGCGADRWEPPAQVMVRWLSRFFNYLDRYYITRHSLAALRDVGMLCFRGA